MATRFALQNNDLVLAQTAARGRRSTVSVVALIYLLVSALPLMMLVCVNVAPAAFGEWHFWRFFLTPLNVVVGAIFFFATVGSCDCAMQPSLVPIIVGIVHFVWTLVVVGFTIQDLIDCAATPWCTVPPATSIDVYFVLWLSGIFACALLEAIMCIVAALLYRIQRRLCLTPCKRRALLRAETGFIQGGAAPGVGVEEETDIEADASEAAAVRLPLIGLPLSPEAFATPPPRGAAVVRNGLGVAASPTSSALLGAQLSDSAVASLRTHNSRHGDLAALTKQQ